MSVMQVLESSAMRKAIMERDDEQGVTICIPCFDQRKFLKTALKSCLAQTVQPLEIIVVDDGSTEDVCGLADSFESPLIRCIRVANRGLPGARNTGLMNARGHAFLPLDADDWIEEDFIEKTLPFIGANDVACVGLEEFGQRHGTYMPGCDLGLGNLTLEDEIRSNRLFYCALYRTALLKECGGWNGHMRYGYEDWDLWIDLMKRGARIMGVLEVLFHYNTRADSMLQNTERHHREWCLDEMARHHGYTR